MTTYRSPTRCHENAQVEMNLGKKKHGSEELVGRDDCNAAAEVSVENQLMCVCVRERERERTHID